MSEKIQNMCLVFQNMSDLFSTIRNHIVNQSVIHVVICLQKTPGFNTIRALLYV